MKRISRYKVTVVREGHSPLYGERTIQSSQESATFLRKHFDNLPHEEFVVVFLDAKHAPAGYQVVSVGSLSLSIVHPREVFKAAIIMNAAAIICAHNHPSGDPTPSNEDRILTERLKSAGELLGIRLLDHIILGDEGKYISFADQGWLGL